jgi:hypothetical protein
MPHVSVIITTCNCSHIVPQAVASAFSAGSDLDAVCPPGTLAGQLAELDCPLKAAVVAAEAKPVEARS